MLARRGCNFLLESAEFFTSLFFIHDSQHKTQEKDDFISQQFIKNGKISA